MLPAPLYLDTARLGTMSLGAQRLHNQFVRLAAEQPSSLYVEKFLKGGISAWPAEYQQRYAGLAPWDGVAGLQSQLAQTIGPNIPGRVVLASRSAALMKLAARRLCEQCRNILTTDLSWRPYQRILWRTARRTGETSITMIPVRRSILRNGITPEELTDQLANAFVRLRCDGLFLPVVDNFGIRLPIASIVAAIRRCPDVRFVVADAAQAIGHVPLDEDAAACDMVIAGTHKWLRAYLPLGIGWLNARPSSAGILHSERATNDLVKLTDPLFQFTEQLTGGSLRHHSETVNLSPLFACRGTLSDREPAKDSSRFQTQLDNAQIVARFARRTGWAVVWPRHPFRSGILLLRHSTASAHSADAIRRFFLQQSIVMSAFERGLIRLSMPRRPLLPDEMLQLQRALETTAMRLRESAATSVRHNDSRSA